MTRGDTCCRSESTQNLLRKEYGLHVERLEPLSGGRVNHLLRAGDWVVKRYDHQRVPRERAERATEIQAMMAASGLPVPSPLRTRAGALWAESEGGMVVVMPFSSGSRRTRGTLTLTEASSLGFLVGTLHERLRQIPVGEMAEPSLPAYGAIQSRWDHLKSQALGVGVQTEFDRIVVETADYVSSALTRIEPVDWEHQPFQLCHGDLHLDNILFGDDDRITGLLDFDNAAPGWAPLELLTAWNLCFCPDPGELIVTPEAVEFVRAYRKASGFAGDLTPALHAYYYRLISNTWPAAIRYQEGVVEAGWTEILSLRYRAARSLEQNMAKLTSHLLK